MLADSRLASSSRAELAPLHNLASQLLMNILCALYEIFTRLGVE